LEEWHLVRERARSIKQSGGWEPELRHKQPYGWKWETPEGEKLEHRNCGWCKKQQMKGL